MSVAGARGAGVSAARVGTSWRRWCAALVAVACLLGLAGSASGGEVVFSSSRCADEADHARRPPPSVPFQDVSSCLDALWLVSDDGSGLQRLPQTGEPDSEVGSTATWSPDGQGLLVSRQGGMAFLDLITGRLQTLTTGGPAYSDVFDAVGRFSPDGTRIVFASTRPAADGGKRPDGDIWVIDRDGSNLHRVTDGSGVDEAPRWTPDGRAVVFVRHPFIFAQGETEPGIYVVSPDGGAPTRVSAGQTGVAVTAVTPSPDGRFLAISSFSGLVVVRADGSDARAVLSTPAPDPVTWAGDRIIFSMPDPKGAHLVSADVTGPQLDLRQVTPAPGSDRHADWTPLAPVGVLASAAAKPIVALTQDLVDAAPGAVPAVNAPMAAPANPLAFFALAARGRARTTASVQRVAHGGCRVWDGRRLGGSCRRERWVTAGSPARWAAKAARLPAGRYRVRFRVRDQRTGATRTSVIRRVSIHR